VRAKQETGESPFDLSKRGVAATIMEQEVEESEISALNIVTSDQVTKRELKEKTEVINKYKRID